MIRRVVVLTVIAGASWGASASIDAESLGEALFHHEWTPNDPLAGGDGLGPVYNATSCVACHDQGGSGGSGGRGADVEHLHPGGNAAPMVLHREGTSESYATWRRAQLRSVPTVSRRPTDRAVSRRNTPALFGIGAIDDIPDQVIVDNASRAPKGVRGRVSKAQSGAVTRFGWKADIETVKDFVIQACAVEIGLSTSGHDAPADPSLATPQTPSAPDISAAQLDGLVAYLSALPAPSDSDHPGRAHFVDAGCADCHTPQLGDVSGIYSDLVLHDLGADLAGSGGAYGGRSRSIAQEWRTPPLWGVADSAPYLHDGRATTLYDAIRLHGGQAAQASARFVLMDPDEQSELQAFLFSLEAPRAN